MFVILLTYKVPLEEVDAHLLTHRAWLREALAAGRLVIAGRKVPVTGPITGGVLIARGTSRADVEAWAATDPFAIADVADFEVIEFSTTFLADGFEALKE